MPTKQPTPRKKAPTDKPKVFAARVPLKGGASHVALSPDGALIAMCAREGAGHVVLLERGAKPRQVRLKNHSSLFSPNEPTWTQELAGLAVVSQEGRNLVLAVWNDSGSDGSGIGLFELDGQPRALHHFLDEETRQKRAGTGGATISSSNLIASFVVSPDRTSCAFRTQDRVELWTVDPLSGQSASKPAGDGLAFDAEGRLVCLKRGDVQELVSAQSAVPTTTLQSDEYLGEPFSLGDVLVTTRGQVFGPAGAVLARLGPLNSGARVGGTLVLSGGPRREEKLWFVDAATGVVKHELPLVGAEAIAANEQLIVVGAKGCAQTMAWPAFS